MDETLCRVMAFVLTAAIVFIFGMGAGGVVEQSNIKEQCAKGIYTPSGEKTMRIECRIMTMEYK